MIDVKCRACEKLLLKASVFIGAIKCSRCKMVFEYKILDSGLLYETPRGIKITETTESKIE